MEEGKEGEEAPGTMSSRDSTEAVDKMSCADERDTAQTTTVNRSENNELEERTEGITAAPTINLTGVTGGAVGTSNMAVVNLGIMGNTFNTLVVTKTDHLHELSVTTKEDIASYTAGMVRVSAVDDVLNKMEVQRWITITGNAGDGKTILGYLVLKAFLEKNVAVFTISEPEEYKKIAKMKKDKVIMFDDRFGEFLADQKMINNWRDVVKGILKEVEGGNPKVKVIFISRKNVVNESKVYLGGLTDSIFDKECVIDLSKRKVTVERRKILEYHLGDQNVTIDPETITRVCNMEVAHGFPFCCKMISKLKSKGNDVPIEEFFGSPLEFLDRTTKVLFNDNCGDLFKQMIKNDGKLNVKNVEDEDKRLALLKIGKEQEDSYITVWRNGVLAFAHPSVYESVLNVINEIDPLYCVQFATLSVIRQKMIISTSDEEDNSRAPCYIIMKSIPDVLEALAERFRKEILRGDYSVFTHRLCQSKDFCEALVSSCICKHENEKQFINQRGKDGDTMMLTAARSGRMAAVHSLVEAGADVNIQNRSGRTALHYLCQLRKSGVRDDDGEGDIVDIGTMRLIITEGGGNVNIPDRFGRTALHYLCQLNRTDDQQLVVINALRLFITEGRGDVNIPDRFGRTALHYLCQLNSTDDQQLVVINALRLFITEGRGDLNHPDTFGHTPLHYLFRCTAFSREEIKFIIFEGKGDLNRCGQHKSTPLHYLCVYSGLQLGTVDLVINEGKGDLNKGDEHGTTPFHYLCENGRVDFNVKLCITNTAKGDINKQDENGITPLHVLCKGTLPMKDVLTLIKEGDKADMYGNTPLHFLCRRRGINAEALQQLKQLPESHMKKRNDLGNTPLDHLNDQDDRLPWTDGMIARSVADLVLCRVKHGDTSTIVLGRAMILNSQKVHRELQVEDFGRELNNMEESGERNTPGQFKKFWGTCSSPLPLPPSPSPLTSPSYWETQSTLRWRGRDGMLLEMGVKEGESNMDEGPCVSFLPGEVTEFVWNNCPRDTCVWGHCVSALRGGVAVSVWGVCRRHPFSLCIQVLRRDQEEELGGHLVGECVSLPLPTSGEEITFTFGLVLDVGRGRVAFLDVGRGKLLCKLNLKFTQPVFPMFNVNPSNDSCATRMRLVSGREISITDQKIQLIQQALSD